MLLAVLATAFAYAAAAGTSVEQHVDARPLAELPSPKGEEIVGLAFGERALWAALSSRRVHRVDPRTGSVRPVPGTSRSIAVAAGEGAVWALQDGPSVDPDSGDQRSILLRIDPASLRVTDRVALGASGLQIATGGGRVWVELFDAIAEIDPADGRVRRRLGADKVEAILATRGALWKITYKRIVERLGPDSTSEYAVPNIAKLDARTGKVLGRAALRGSRNELGADGGSIIALNAGSRGLSVIDAGAREVRETGAEDFCDDCGAWLASDATRTWIVGVREDPDTQRETAGYLRRATRPQRVLRWGGAALRGCCAAVALGDGAVFVTGSAATISRIDLP